MSIKNRSTRVVAGGAAALGLTLGVAGLAGAATSPDQTAPTDPTVDSTGVEQDEVQDPTLDGSIQAPEDESLSEADEAKALEGLATISPADAEQAALATVPGGTVNGPATLGNENGSVVYEVDVTADDGTETEVKVDAGNGDILDRETGDSEGDEGTESEDEADEADEADEVAPVG